MRSYLYGSYSWCVLLLFKGWGRGQDGVTLYLNNKRFIYHELVKPLPNNEPPVEISWFIDFLISL